MAEHIRIGDIAPRVHYAADGAQTVFTYPFPIFEVSDLELRVDGVVQNDGFQVTGAGASGGGTVVFAAAPAAGRQVLLRRVLPVERLRYLVRDSAPALVLTRESEASVSAAIRRRVFPAMSRGRTVARILFA